MDSLRLLDSAFRAFDRGLPDAAPIRCVATRYQLSACRRCVDVCPGDAITPSPWLAVDPDRCTGCAACSAACRTGALTFAVAGLDAPAVAFGSAVEISCDQAEPGPRGPKDGAFGSSRAPALGVPCVGALREADLVGLAAAGVSSLTLRAGDCEACPSRRASNRAVVVASAAVAALGALGARFSVTIDHVPSRQPAAVPGPSLSRRAVFTYVRDRTRRALAETLVQQARDVGELHRQAPPPPAHLRLVRSLSALQAIADAGAGGNGAVELPEGAVPLARIAVTDGCDGCGLCAVYCPHGAIRMIDLRPLLDEPTCTACGLCAEVCPPSALSLLPARLPLAPLLADALSREVPSVGLPVSIPGAREGTCADDPRDAHMRREALRHVGRSR
jgi:ferredoxin